MNVNDIIELLRPYLPKDAEAIFFQTHASIMESERSHETRQAYEGSSKRREVYAKGVIIDPERDNHQVLYEHRHRMPGGYMFSTVMGRPLNELSGEELTNLYKDLSDKVSAGKVFPAVITEGYDEDYGIEDHSYFSVVFDKPYDEEQMSVADRYECETINPDKSEYIFMDYDDAIGFADDNTTVIEKRGQTRREQGDDERFYFHVTFESGDPRLKDLAEKHDGAVDYGTIGVPVAMATFANVRDANAYRREASEILSAKKEVEERTNGLSDKTNVVKESNMHR